MVARPLELCRLWAVGSGQWILWTAWTPLIDIDLEVVT